MNDSTQPNNGALAIDLAFVAELEEALSHVMPNLCARFPDMDQEHASCALLLLGGAYLQRLDVNVDEPDEQCKVLQIVSAGARFERDGAAAAMRDELASMERDAARNALVDASRRWLAAWDACDAPDRPLESAAIQARCAEYVAARESVRAALTAFPESAPVSSSITPGAPDEPM